MLAAGKWSGPPPIPILSQGDAVTTHPLSEVTGCIHPHLILEEWACPSPPYCLARILHQMGSGGGLAGQEASPAPRWPKTLNVVIFLQFSQKTKETKGGPQKVVIFLQFSRKTKKHKRFEGRWELSGAHATPCLPSNLWFFWFFWEN